MSDLSATNSLLCKDSEGRISLSPLQYPDIYAFREEMEKGRWTAGEVSLSDEKEHWDSLTDDERHFVSMQLAFFSTIDIVVLDNINMNFANEIKCLEVKMVLAAQADQECVHAKGYVAQIESVIEDGEERQRILNSAATIPIIKKIREWVMKWFDTTMYSLEIRLIAFAFVEGIMFCASFCALQWLRDKGKLPGITKFNKWIRRDEFIHTRFACYLIGKYIGNKPSFDIVINILTEAINILDEFVNESIPVKLIGMSAPDMRQYVRFQADRVLTLMKYPIKYNTTDPFPSMIKDALNKGSKSDFFIVQPTEYQGAIVDRKNAEFVETDDF